ncbi:MAG: Calx-beta domain-containing protein, partial [Bacteroidota bacterium]
MQRFFFLCFAAAVFFGCDGQEATPISRFNVDVSSFEEKDTDQSYTIVFTADAVASEDISIAYELQELSAKFDDDFIGQSGTLDIAAGSDQASIEIVVKGDTHLELEESFELLLYSETTIRYGFTIKDNDTETIIMQDNEGYYTP